MLILTQIEVANIFDFASIRKNKFLNWIDTFDFLFQRQLDGFVNEQGIRRRNLKTVIPSFEDRLCKASYLDDKLGNYCFIYEQGSASVNVSGAMFDVSQSLRLVICTSCDNISELTHGLVRLLAAENIQGFTINTNKEEVYREVSGKEKTNNNAINLAYIDFTLQYFTDYDCTEYICKKC